MGTTLFMMVKSGGQWTSDELGVARMIGLQRFPHVVSLLR